MYAVAPHTGRGGWTWYTGSAGWMYRLITESLLGLRLEVDTLHFRPHMPNAWDTFKAHYRYRETHYHILFHRGTQNAGVRRVEIDGKPSPHTHLKLIDDRQHHQVDVHLG